MAEEERWLEVWKGTDPSAPGRLLEQAGIEMRLASAGWGAHGGGLGFLGLFRRQGRSRLLVREAERERARAALRG